MGEVGVEDPYAASDEILGACGRQLSGTKQPRPGQRVVWNANVCVRSRGKIWFGDIDLNAQGERLKELAVLLGEKVYVLRERDARFANENSPLYEQAVAVFG